MVDELTMKTYTAVRQALLERMVKTLAADGRFAAGWLEGSFGRGQQDALSDLDLTVVVRDEHCAVLCEHPWLVSAQTTPERWALFSQFGEPIILHENHHNAPKGGTFTFVMYAQPEVMVDWVLRPQKGAERPAETVLLWDHAGIPVSIPQEAGSPEKQARDASERIAFFWMMSAVTLKHIYRKDWAFTTHWLNELEQLIYGVENLIQGFSDSEQTSSFRIIPPDKQAQIEMLLELGERMAVMVPEVEAMGAKVLPAPVSTLETLARLVH